MKKGLIEWLFTSFGLGFYLFYYEPIIAFLKGMVGLEWLTDSPYLYAIGGLCVFFFTFLVGKAVTRGMK